MIVHIHLHSVIHAYIYSATDRRAHACIPAGHDVLCEEEKVFFVELEVIGVLPQ